MQNWIKVLQPVKRNSDESESIVASEVPARQKSSGSADYQAQPDGGG